MPRRHLSSFAVAALAGLSLSGCGASSDPLGTVRSAASLTLSQSLEAIVTVRGGVFLGSPRPIDARAAFSLPAGLGYEAADVPLIDGRPSGVTYLDFDPTQVDVAPFERRSLPAGRLWIAATFPQAGSSGTRYGALALSLEALDPQLLLTEIVGGAMRATSVGERIIEHVPYTEYHLSVNLARVRSATCATSAGAICAAVRQELAAVRAERTRGVSAEIAVWVDGQGRVVQLDAALPGSGWTSVLISLSSFGVTIPRTRPLTSQVVGLSSLARAGWALSASSVLTGSPSAGAG